MKQFLQKRNIVVGIILLANLVFAYKYFNRYTNYTLLIILPLILFYYFQLNMKLQKLSNKMGYLFFVIINILFLLFSIIIFNKIEAETLNVDRWSVITSFWDSVFENQYPYYAKSYAGNPPGPMPVYFILAFPFYLVKELGFLSVSGSMLFFAILFCIKKPLHNINKIAILIFSSVFYLWEIVSRSNIFFNAVIALIVLVHFNLINKNNKKLYINAILAGLLLSTRSILILPYIVVFLSALIRKEIQFQNMIKHGLVTIFSFTITFLPFVIFFPNDFFIMNPFIVQSTFFLPPIFSIVFVILAVVASFIAKSKDESYFYSGIVLFCSILIYFFYYIIKSGFYQAYLQSEADISYFIFCIPFLLLYFVKTEQKHSLEQKA